MKNQQGSRCILSYLSIVKNLYNGFNKNDSQR